MATITDNSMLWRPRLATNSPHPHFAPPQNAALCKCREMILVKEGNLDSAKDAVISPHFHHHDPLQVSALMREIERRIPRQKEALLTHVSYRAIAILEQNRLRWDDLAFFDVTITSDTKAEFPVTFTIDNYITIRPLRPPVHLVPSYQSFESQEDISKSAQALIAKHSN